MTPPSPKKEFVEMAEVIGLNWFNPMNCVYGHKPTDHRSSIEILAQALQSVDAKAREEEAEGAKEVIEDLMCQFAYYVQGGGYTTGGLSALEGAFEFLGWKDPHLEPRIKCQFDEKCPDRGDCGTPYKDGYVRCCGKHYQVIQQESSRHPKPEKEKRT